MFYLETFLLIILLIPKSFWSLSEFDGLSLKITTEPVIIKLTVAVMFQILQSVLSSNVQLQSPRMAITYHSQISLHILGGFLSVTSHSVTLKVILNIKYHPTYSTIVSIQYYIILHLRRGGYFFWHNAIKGNQTCTEYDLLNLNLNLI